MENKDYPTDQEIEVINTYPHFYKEVREVVKMLWWVLALTLVGYVCGGLLALMALSEM